MRSTKPTTASPRGARFATGGAGRIIIPIKLGPFFSDRVVQFDRLRKRRQGGRVSLQRASGRRSSLFSALTGDTADGIPGLRGFGEKSAGMLLGAYEHLEHIPDHVHQWKVKPRGALALATTLAEHRADALLYRKLATLVDTVPLAESLDDLRFRGVPRTPSKLLRELGVHGDRHLPNEWAPDLTARTVRAALDALFGAGPFALEPRWNRGRSLFGAALRRAALVRFRAQAVKAPPYEPRPGST